MPPVHSLDEVRRFAAAAGAHVQVSEHNATEPVANLFSLTPEAAEAYVLALVGRLLPQNYAHTLTNKTPPADVYGLEFEGRAWYIKVAFYRGLLVVISCHPPTEPLRTLAGTVKR